MSAPLDRLKHHVTGAIERGEAEAIAAMVSRTYLVRSERMNGDFAYLCEMGDSTDISTWSFGVDRSKALEFSETQAKGYAEDIDQGAAGAYGRFAAEAK